MAVDRYAGTHGGGGHHETASGGFHVLRWTVGHVPTHPVHEPTPCVVV